jgi:signal transduction histidine kinase
MQLTREYDLGSTKEEEIKNFTSIIDASSYLSQTIDDFKNFFNPNKQKVVFNLKDTYIKTFNIISSKFSISNIEICKNIDDIKLNNLENELMQVIMNILNNARDELESKDQKRIIFIDIFENNKNAIVKITDNAGGIPENIINRVFDSYFTTKENKEGTGIGLHMSKEIIEKNIGGTLEVENSTYNHDDIEYTGACFTITIPIENI